MRLWSELSEAERERILNECQDAVGNRLRGCDVHRGALKIVVTIDDQADERVVFDVVCRAYPQAVTRTKISEQTEYLRSSRDTFIQRLASRRLVVTKRDGVVASEELFG